MTVTHVSDPTHYQTVLRQGSVHIFEVDVDDLDQRLLFEQLDIIDDPSQPFTLPPFDVIDPQVQAHPWLLSDQWGLIVDQVHSRKGHITYCRRPSGRYLAACKFPSPFGCDK